MVFIKMGMYLKLINYNVRMKYCIVVILIFMCSIYISIYICMNIFFNFFILYIYDIYISLILVDYK